MSFTLGASGIRVFHSIADGYFVDGDHGENGTSPLFNFVYGTFPTHVRTVGVYSFTIIKCVSGILYVRGMYCIAIPGDVICIHAGIQHGTAAASSACARMYFRLLAGIGEREAER